MKRIDIIAGLVLGEIVAVFLIFVLKRLDYFFNLAWFLLVVLPPMVLFALFIAYLLGKRFPTIFQFGKYATVGFANAGVDFGVLNFLMWMTRIYSGKWILLLNSVSFVIAVTHSYIWNKYWSFRARGQTDVSKQFIVFIIVTVIGAVVSGGIVYGVTTFISPLFSFSLVRWANVAKVLASVIAILWNFIGYKFIVFKK